MGSQKHNDTRVKIPVFKARILKFINVPVYNETLLGHKKEQNCRILKFINMPIYNGILLIYRQEWNCAIFRNVDGPGGYCIESNKSERGKQI